MISHFSQGHVMLSNFNLFSSTAKQNLGSGQPVLESSKPLIQSVDSKYRYEPSDILNILKIYFRSRPDIVILETALMDINSRGSRLSDIIRAYRKDKTSLDFHQKTMLIIPILENGKWTALRLNLVKGEIESGVFYYRRVKFSFNMLLMDYLASDLKKEKLMSALIYFTPAGYLLEESDIESNAVFLIENIYCNIQNISHPAVASLDSKIRTIHQNLLRQYMPTYYAEFMSRQSSVCPAPNTLLSSFNNAPNCSSTSTPFQNAADPKLVEKKQCDENSFVSRFLNF